MPRSATVQTRQPSILSNFDPDHIAHSLPQGRGHLQYNRHQSDQRSGDDHPLHQYAAIQSMKMGIVDLAGLATTPVFSFPFFRRYPFFFALAIAYLLGLLHLQEIILLGAVRSLMHFLNGTFAKTRIIATTTLIVAATHLHMKSLVFHLHIIVPNIFWCWLYDKHRSLLCVSVSHILIGVGALFILGSRGNEH